jgi:hypothetical protein
LDSEDESADLHEHEDVHGVVVLAERPGHEAVVVRVDDGRVEDPVHLDEPRLLVQLVLHLAPLGDLHDLLVGTTYVTDGRTRTGRIVRHAPYSHMSIENNFGCLLAGVRGLGNGIRQILTTLKTAGASGPAEQRRTKAKASVIIARYISISSTRTSQRKRLTDLEVVPGVRGDGPPRQRRQDALVQPRRPALRLHLHHVGGVLPVGASVLLVLAHLPLPLRKKTQIGRLRLRRLAGAGRRRSYLTSPGLDRQTS